MEKYLHLSRSLPPADRVQLTYLARSRGTFTEEQTFEILFYRSPSTVPPCAADSIEIHLTCHRGADSIPEIRRST